MQSLSLAKYDEYIFPEDIVAWECGPAIKEVNSYFVKFLFENKNKDMVANLFLSDHEKEIFKSVYNATACLTTSQLIKITQNEEPWKITYNQGKGQNKPITGELLKKWFGGLPNGMDGMDKLYASV